MDFPQLTATNLEGETIKIPQDLQGKLNVLVVAFLQRQQYDVDSWIPFLEGLKTQFPAIDIYELPTLKKFNAISRWIINTGMRSGIPNQDTRKHTITLYIDKQRFREALDIPDETAIYLFIVNQAGKILYRTSGVYTPNQGQALQEQLQKVYSRNQEEN